MIRAVILLVVTLAACNAHEHATLDGPAPGDDAAIDAAHADALADATLDAPADAPPLADPFAALQAMPGKCADGWCWKFQTPHGNDYYGVFGTGADNVWLYGARGTIMQWNGHAWTYQHPVPLPGQDFVMMPVDLQGRGPNDMWLILMSAVEHWDGANWTIFETGPTNVSFYYHRLWMCPNGDVWLISNLGVERSHNGAPFELVLPRTNLTTVWGTSETDVYASGPGTVMHFDGTTWTQTFPTAWNQKIPGNLMGFPNDVWASGAHQTLEHYDGTTWTHFDPPGVGIDTAITKVAALAPDDVWWFTAAGSIDESFLHWNGHVIERFSLTDAPAMMGAAIVDGTWWVVAREGGVYTKVGATTLAPIVAPLDHWHGGGMWGTSDTNLYFGSSKSIDHWDGAQWTSNPIPLGVSGGVDGIAGAGIGGADELFVLSWEIDFTDYTYRYSLDHWDGATWTKMPIVRNQPFEPALQRVRATGHDEAIVWGQRGVAYRYSHGTFTTIATGTTEDLYGGWGPDLDHLMIGGTHGTLLQWSRANPDVFTPDASFPPTTDDLGSISGGGDLVWVGHLNKTVLSKRDAAGAWSDVTTNVLVQNVLALSAKEIYVTTTGHNSYISHWNGSGFTIEDYGFEYQMYTMFRAPAPDSQIWLTDGSLFMTHP